MKDDETLNIISSGTLPRISRQEYIEKMRREHTISAKGSDIFLFGSLDEQNGAKIASLVRQIKAASKDKLADKHNYIELKIDGGRKTDDRDFNLYIDCPDDELSEKSQKVLRALQDEILKQDLTIRLHALRAGTDKLASAMNNMLNNHQIKMIREFGKGSK